MKGVMVRFVDIGEVVDDHCFKFLFIIQNKHVL